MGNDYKGRQAVKMTKPVPRAGAANGQQLKIMLKQCELFEIYRILFKRILCYVKLLPHPCQPNTS